MIRCVRIWTGDDQNSHAEEGFIDLAPGARGDFLTGKLGTSHALFQETRSGGTFEWHTAPVRQLVITLSGTLDFQTRGGQHFILKPGEILFAEGAIPLNAGRPTAEVSVTNTSDHTIFISSHFPFFEVNRRLVFDRARAWGMHLDVPAGDSVRWRPGETRTVRLVAYGGQRTLRGFNRLTDGPATPDRLAGGLARVREGGYGHREAGLPEGSHGR
jgi:urease beta subunit